jgi:hypothetical protein
VRRGVHGLALLVALAVASPGPARADDAARGASASGAPGLSLQETLAWLEEEVEAHGRFQVEYRGERLVLRAGFDYRLLVQPAGSCTLSVELRITNLDDPARVPDPAHPGGSQGVVGVFHLRDVQVAGVGVRPWPQDRRVHAVTTAPGGSVRCVRIPLQRDASRSTTATEPGMEYEYASGDLCLADAAAAERVAQGIRHAARLCGARP